MTTALAEVFGGWRIACKGCGETITDEDSAVMLNGWTDEQGGKYCSQECADAAEVAWALDPDAPFFRPPRGREFEVGVVRHVGMYEYDMDTGRPFPADRRPRQVGRREMYLIRTEGRTLRWAIPPAVKREMRNADANLTEISGRTFVVCKEGHGMQTRYRVKEKRP